LHRSPTRTFISHKALAAFGYFKLGFLNATDAAVKCNTHQSQSVDTSTKHQRLNFPELLVR